MKNWSEQVSNDANFFAMDTIRSLLLVCLLYIGHAGWAHAAEPKDVSMIQLIADPQKFDGQVVRLVGFLRLEFEGNAVYLHREDFQRAIFQNSVWIELTDAQLRSSAKLNNGYVVVEGTFNAREKGHLDIWPGSLQRVNRISIWSVDRNRRPSRFKQ